MYYHTRKSKFIISLEFFLIVDANDEVLFYPVGLKVGSGSR
jgi:hypothetical protein